MREEFRFRETFKFRNGSIDEQIMWEVGELDCYYFDKWQPRKPPKIIVDVGCQIGCFSVMACNRFQNCSVLSFEMIKENFDLAKFNLSAYKNSQCFNSAVCGENKILGSRCPVPLAGRRPNTGGYKAVFEGSDSYLSKERNLSKISSEAELGDVTSSINFEQIFEQHEISEIDFLKLDCEGSEHEIIPHLIKSGLIKKIRNISLEMHGRDQKEFDDIISYLFKNYDTVIGVNKGNIVLCRER
jgi:FkbM family methyltransferase